MEQNSNNVQKLNIKARETRETLAHRTKIEEVFLDCALFKFQV